MKAHVDVYLHFYFLKISYAAGVTGALAGAAGVVAGVWRDFFKASFKALPALNFGTHTGGMVIAWEGFCGLTPILPLRTRAEKVPKPVKVTSPPPLMVLVIVSVMNSTISSACFLATPCFSEINPTNSALFIGLDYEKKIALLL